MVNFENKKVGLVLSGGGSKGLAHAGVLKFLEEKNIKPDIIAGTSAGAIVGGLYGAGKTPEEILEFFKSIYFFNWKHFTFKKPGLIDSASFKAYFRHQFKDIMLSELSIPVYITATDLVSGRLKIFDKDTQVIDAVLASSAFPGMVSPYIIDNKLYCDGGILNHFPSDLLQGQCDVIIGVYVSPIQNVEASQLKSIKSITMRAYELLTGHTNYMKFTYCDWVIEPNELVKYGTFETNQLKMDKIFNIGYENAKNSFDDFVTKARV